MGINGSCAERAHDVGEDSTKILQPQELTKLSKLSSLIKAIFHCSRFARAGEAGFENLNSSPALAKRTLMENGLYVLKHK
jgi:hypothetical protein